MSLHESLKAMILKIKDGPIYSKDKYLFWTLSDL